MYLKNNRESEIYVLTHFYLYMNISTAKTFRCPFQNLFGHFSVAIELKFCVYRSRFNLVIGLRANQLNNCRYYKKADI